MKWKYHKKKKIAHLIDSLMLERLMADVMVERMVAGLRLVN